MPNIKFAIVHVEVLKPYQCSWSSIAICSDGGCALNALSHSPTSEHKRARFMYVCMYVFVHACFYGMGWRATSSEKEMQLLIHTCQAPKARNKSE